MGLFVLARGCPNCSGPITDNRLVKGFPCQTCLPVEGGNVCQRLADRGQLQGLWPYCLAQREETEFILFFKKALGVPPSNLQLSWARRLFLGESLAIVAPTGLGKTTFGLAAILFGSGRSLVLTPTRLLADQLGRRLEEMARSTGLRRRILIYQSRNQDKKDLCEGNFDILVGTTAFFYRQFPLISSYPFRFVFVDDVDSFLRRSSQIDLLFRLLGFEDREISLAKKLRLSPGEERLLEKARKRTKDRILIISSATLRPRTSRVLLFQRLLGFDVHQATITLRRLEDTYLEVPSPQEALEMLPGLVKRLGQGGILLVASELGREFLEYLTNRLRSAGLSLVSYLETSPEKLYQRLSEGNFDLALGLAHPTNPLVRGIDLPQILRYVIFFGVPKHLFPTKLSLTPASLLGILKALMPILEDDDRVRLLTDAAFLRRYLGLKEEQIERYPKIKERLVLIKQYLEGLLKDQSLLRRLRQSQEVFLEERPEGLFLVVADTTTYLQATGRVSRLTVSGLTRGLSLVLTWEPRALASLKRRLGFLPQAISLKPFSSVDLEGILREIDHDRARVSSGAWSSQILKVTLVVVESPHKARTIASFFGRPAKRWIGEALAYEIPLEGRILLVTASLGHILNLCRRKGIFGVIREKDYFLPWFDTIKVCRSTGEELVDQEELSRCPPAELWDKATLVSGLQRLAFWVDEVLVASDPDAEGEKIAHDLRALVRPFQKKVFRVEFHEVTPRALKEALENPGQFHLPRVRAQLTRRILDRWVGFGLSRRLWQALGRRRLSAGRVQTPVLGWIIERVRVAKKKKARLEYLFGGERFSLEIDDLVLAREIFKKMAQAKIKLEKKVVEDRQPLPPFTTDAILEEAHRRLGLSARQTMAILQELFEAGLITYHRTDSTRVSDYGRFQVARAYIAETFGKDFFYPRAFSAEGAHEAIRPTKPHPPERISHLLATDLLDLREPKLAISLYDLIFRRFMASQMRPARIERAVFSFSLPAYSWQETVVTKIIVSGFELLWPTFSLLKSAEIVLRPLRWEKISKVPLFTQGSLIREMKIRGLGRPSTYADIISTLLNRGYIVERRGFLMPTSLGKRVYTFLKEEYPYLVDETFTRELEEVLDRIEDGEEDWQRILRDVFKRLKSTLLDADHPQGQ